MSRFIMLGLGVSPTGKSSFIQHATANREEYGGEGTLREEYAGEVTLREEYAGEGTLREEYAGEGTHSVTEKVQPFKLGHDKELDLIDTPGSNDTELSDTDILPWCWLLESYRNEVEISILADWLPESYRDEVEISGIPHLHRISDVRTESSAMRNLLMSRKPCEKDSIKNVTLGTASRSLIGQKKGAAHVEELLQTEGVFKYMTEQGCGFVRVSGNCDADLELLSRFAVKSPSVMDLQKELLNGKSWAETAAVSAIGREPAELQIENFFGCNGDCPSIGFALKSLSQESESEPTERERLLYLRVRERRDQLYKELAGQIDRIRSTVDLVEDLDWSLFLVEDLNWSLCSMIVRPWWKCCNWAQQTLQWMLAPLEQEDFGGVVPCQILRRSENPTFSKRIYSFLGALYLERRGDRMFSSASGRDDPHRPQPPPAKMSPDDDDEDGHFGFCKATNWEVPEGASNSTTQVRADRQWSVDASTIAIWKAVIMRTCIHHFRVQRPGPCSDHVESRSRGGGHHVIGDVLRTTRLLCA